MRVLQAGLSQARADALLVHAVAAAYPELAEQLARFDFSEGEGAVPAEITAWRDEARSLLTNSIPQLDAHVERDLFCFMPSREEETKEFIAQVLARITALAARKPALGATGIESR